MRHEVSRGFEKVELVSRYVIENIQSAIIELAIVENGKKPVINSPSNKRLLEFEKFLIDNSSNKNDVYLRTENLIGMVDIFEIPPKEDGEDIDLTPYQKINAPELKTENKTITGSINELLDKKHEIEYKVIGSNTESFDLLEFALTAVKGNYKSQSGSNLVTGIPEDISKAFECRITSINEEAGYSTIELKPYNENAIYINSQISSKIGENYPKWTGWSKVANSDNVISSNGGDITGQFNIVGVNEPIIIYNKNKAKILATIGNTDTDTSIIVKNNVSNKHIKLKNDGSAEFQATNLTTNSKDLILAVNELKALIDTLTNKNTELEKRVKDLEDKTNVPTE